MNINIKTIIKCSNLNRHRTLTQREEDQVNIIVKVLENMCNLNKTDMAYLKTMSVKGFEVKPTLP